MASAFILAAVSVFLQFTAINYTRQYPPTVNLPLLVLIFFSLTRGVTTGTALGVFLGAILGILGIGPFGLHVFLYTTVGFLVAYTGKWFYREDSLIFILMVFCSLLFVYLTYFAFRLQGPQVHLFGYMIRFMVPSAAYNILASLFLFYFLKEIKP